MTTQTGRSTSGKNANGYLGSAVAANGTFTVSYPSKDAPESGVTDSGDFYGAVWHTLVMNGAKLIYPTDFDISFGTSSITVTNKTSASWPANSRWFLNLDEQGKSVYSSDRDNKGTRMARMSRADTVLVNLGAPDTASSNGVCLSQSVSASTDATLNGALVSGGVATFDVPRNIVAAWTTSATLTFTGTDEYGRTVVESSAAGTSHTGKKAFKTVTRVFSDTAITSLTVGTGTKIGLPFFLQSQNQVVAEIINGAVVGDKATVRLTGQINATDLAAGTAQYFPAPCAGRLVRLSTAVQVALSTGTADLGQVYLTVNGSIVTGSSSASYTTATGGNGSVGDISSALVPSDSALAVVAEGDAIGVVPSATWASAGALNWIVEVAPTGSGIYHSGTFVTGNLAAGAQTATTNDIRGTYTPPVTPDGTYNIQLLVALGDVGNRGVTAQYAG